MSSRSHGSSGDKVQKGNTPARCEWCRCESTRSWPTHNAIRVVSFAPASANRGAVTVEYRGRCSATCAQRASIGFPGNRKPPHYTSDGGATEHLTNTASYPAPAPPRAPTNSTCEPHSAEMTNWPRKPPSCIHCILATLTAEGCTRIHSIPAWRKIRQTLLSTTAMLLTLAPMQIKARQ